MDGFGFTVRKRACLRSQRGGFTTLAFVGLIPLLIALAAFGIEFKHQQTAQQQLQKATDAAALAGAEMLWSDGTYDINSNTYTPDSGNTVVTQKALAVAQLNIAEGEPVSNNTPGCTINVGVESPTLPVIPPPIMLPPPALQGLGITNLPALPLNQVQALFAPTQGGTTGTVTVTASMEVKNFFAGIFGHQTDTVTAVSKAGSSGPAYTVYAGQLFPLAVSWLSVPKVSVGGTQVHLDLPLVLKRVGDPVAIVVGQAVSQNGGLTVFNTGAPSSYVSQAIDQYLGVSPLVVDDPTRVIPALKVGDNVRVVNDSGAFNHLISRQAQLRGKVIYMPVIVTELPLSVVTGIIGPSVGSLVNNVNNTAINLLGLRQVIGFVAVKVDKLSVNPAGDIVIEGMIVNGQRFGSNRLQSPGLLPALLDAVLGLIGLSGGNLLPTISPGQTYPLTGTQAVKLIQ